MNRRFLAAGKYLIRKFSRLMALLTLSIFLLTLDYLSGPKIGGAVLFGIPVALAALTVGWRTGIAFALVLPAIQMGYNSWWSHPWPYAEILINTGIRIMGLSAITLIITVFMRVYQSPRTSTLPSGLCCFCKQPYQIPKKRLGAKIVSEDEFSGLDQNEQICPTCASLFKGHLKESDRMAGAA